MGPGLRATPCPWQSGLTGIAYNADATGEVAQLRGAAHPQRPQGPDHAAHRDARHDGLHAQGRRRATRTTSPTTSGTTRSTCCGRRSPTARSARSPATSTSRTSPPGNIVACEAWSGDVIQAQFDNPNIKFVVPEEGLSLWSDNMLVPNLAEHKANAEKWMNYYYDPRSRRSSPPGSTTSAPSRAPRRRWRRSTPTWSTTR